MTAPIPSELVEEIRAGTDIAVLVSEYVVLKKQGRNHVGLCPFHREKTPSFSVSTEKQMFYCFGCGAGGNAYTFIMKIKNLSFPEAVAALAERAGISLPQTGEAASGANEKEQRLLALNQLAARFYSSLLEKHPSAQQARKYLEGRGITPAVQQQFQLGYAPDRWDSLLSLLAQRGYQASEVIEAGLALAKEQGGSYDRFRHRVMFPIFDGRQRVVAFGGRVLDGSKPKYLNSPDSLLFHKGRLLYGLHLAAQAFREAGYGIVVEGYMDVIIAHRYGINNTVASLGTSLTFEQARLLRRHTQEVVIAYDADTAGQAATVRGMDILRQVGCRVKVAELPEGLDPDDFLRKYGAPAFRSLIEKESRSLVAYRLERIAANHDLSTVEGKVEAINASLPDLQRITHAVEKDEYVHYVAKRLDLAPEAIFAELRRQNGEMQKYGTLQDKIDWYRHNKDTVILNRSNPERFLLRWLLEDPAIMPRLRQELDDEVFSSVGAREIAACVEQYLQEDVSIPIANIIDRVEGTEAKQILAEVAMEPFNLPEDGKGMEDVIRRVRVERLGKLLDERQRELKMSEKSGGSEGIRLRELLSQVQALQKEIDKLKSLK